MNFFYLNAEYLLQWGRIGTYNIAHYEFNGQTDRENERVRETNRERDRMREREADRV